MPTDSVRESSATDIVFMEALRVSANVGPDCWNRERQQPIEVTVYLHLKESYLQLAGRSDNVLDSVHYGHLTKSITSLIKSRNESDNPSFDGTDDLIASVTQRAFELAKDAATEVRVVLNVPKMILLAAGFSIDATTLKEMPNQFSMKKVSVQDIVLPVIIGVNPPERETKQRVVINIIFCENPLSEPGKAIDYREIIINLSKDIENSSYLTLEKFVMEIIRTACLSSELLHSVTIRAQKPSALSFAQSSGVEITRVRTTFI